MKNITETVFSFKEFKNKSKKSSLILTNKNSFSINELNGDVNDCNKLSNYNKVNKTDINEIYIKNYLKEEKYINNGLSFKNLNKSNSLNKSIFEDNINIKLTNKNLFSSKSIQEKSFCDLSDKNISDVDIKNNLIKYNFDILKNPLNHSNFFNEISENKNSLIFIKDLDDNKMTKNQSFVNYLGKD